ncbi:MAG: 50S ribosomal protein L17 [Candidatus Levybacteria bacterium RIFCSPHIGHO2_02_FULL_39_36]|nr:MAG: 50S ribosomal protein L17 [Candidatus Levybacteria bacterium GW2011_GWA1_39_11]KKR24997.1 MAG: 50S ribosomal protein L17 [Candidatus Levybacteria bacterium GW2011_GWB1_39_7]KKR27554.1 MAG: 50S ribosomal protein L17 [Microgenomates group bacterium GW2011_GWC1_39_7]KKR48398.1 MAG: 50S ribosomal protein L17 [Candidatus Levybacteria bacterium GW2011_GWA2_40_16]OGH15480.1 MAG: 50S ribosomal protein L17 [Candidatus Levybacteria bacterium RIFCSPHIGHO2_01_FULL_38_96]OGH25612.1 MAG: 50S ribosom
MRKRIFGRRFRRDTNERKALFKSLMNSLILHGKIKTTEAKAKAIKGEVEKIVTRAKAGEAARRIITAKLGDTRAVEKVIGEIAPKFAERPGGYTRLLKLGSRVKDGASVALLTWVEEVLPTPLKEPKRNTKKKTTKPQEKPKKTQAKKEKKSVKK